MKKFLQLMSLIIIQSCISGNAPVMERKIKVWNGIPETGEICRTSSVALASNVGGIAFVLKAFHKGTFSKECISTKDEAFKKYGSLTFEDIGVLYDYIQALNYKCEKWSK
jgi:hypothetical protein